MNLFLAHKLQFFCALKTCKKAPDHIKLGIFLKSYYRLARLGYAENLCILS